QGPPCAWNEQWMAGCQSRLATTSGTAAATPFTTPKMASPRGTARAPPGQKSTCGSTIKRAFGDLGFSVIGGIIRLIPMDMTQPVLLTREGLERLKNELVVVRERRDEAAERMKEAAKPGTAEDNPEYETA